MFALAKSASNELLSFEFGTVVDPREWPGPERLRWILEDVDSRRNELILMSASQASNLLLDQLQAEPANPSIPAIRALGYLRNPNTAAVLETFLTNPSNDVVIETILALGRIGAHRSMPKLEEFLTSSDHYRKSAAVIALSRRIQRADFDILDRTTDDDPDLHSIVEQGKRRVAALEARDLLAFVKATLEMDEWDDLVPTVEATGPSLIKVLDDDSNSALIRERALSVIATSRYPRAGAQIEAILTHPASNPLLHVAIIAAGRCRCPNDVESLTELLTTAPPGLIPSIIQSLGESRAADALSPLLAQWSSQGGTLRTAIRIALRRIAPTRGSGVVTEWLRSGSDWKPSAIYFISDAFELDRRYNEGMLDSELSSANIEARRDAVLLMAYLAGRKEADKLTPLNKDEDPEVKSLAAFAEGRLRGGK